MDFWKREEAGGECELVGEEMATLVGNGVLVGFAGQALLSLCLSLWVFFLTKHGNMDITHPEGSIGRIIERKRMEFVMNVLTVGSDFQSTLGIAYMITTFSQAKIMDTYHLHLVFDISSFVGVSNTIVLVCWRYCRAKIDEPDAERRGRRERVPWYHGRYRAAYIFLALYLALTIWLEIRLDDWALDKEPVVAITHTCIFAGVIMRRAILVLCALHFPLHLYMTIALRQANQGKFAGEVKHENEWDFGQTTAVLLLGIAVLELVAKGIEYYEFETYVAKHGVPLPADDQSFQKDEEASAGGYLLGPLPRNENILEERQETSKVCHTDTKDGYQQVASS